MTQTTEFQVYRDIVRVKCNTCKVEHDNELVYGEETNYPDDFFINCDHCSNTEEGTFPIQGFEILEVYTRRHL